MSLRSRLRVRTRLRSAIRRVLAAQAEAADPHVSPDRR